MLFAVRSAASRVFVARALTLYVLIFASCTDQPPTAPLLRPQAAVAPGNAVEVFLQAHADDWQLFLGDRVAAAVASPAPKVVLIYTTAADAGSKVNNPAYWQSREAAGNASVDSITPGAGAWSCASKSISGHPLKRCIKGKVVSYYLRLPDGGGAGQGYGYGSLDLLRDDRIADLFAVDNTTKYSSFADLTETIRKTIEEETKGYADVAVGVHAPEWDLALNSGDHPDHLTTGALTRAAASAHDWNRYWYIGYGNVFLDPNVSGADYDTKWKLILAYNAVMVSLMGETIIGTSHAEEWVLRTYFRTEVSGGVLGAAPTAPALLLATATSPEKVELRWTDTSRNEDGFRVERAVDVEGIPGAFVEIAVNGKDDESYNDSDAASATRNWYRVRAFNEFGVSDYSNVVSAVTPPWPTAPVAPGNVQGTAFTTTALDLTWTDNSSNEASFRIERAEDNNGVPGNFGSGVNVGANTTTYRATGLRVNRRYWFRVRAQNSVGNSAYVPMIESVATLDYSPPSNLAVVITDLAERAVALTWSTGNAPKIDIWRNGQRIKDGEGNDGAFNNKPSSSLGATVTYQVCIEDRTAAEHCTLPFGVTF